MEADPAEADTESPDGGELTEESARDLMEIDGLEGLGELPDKLQDNPLKPLAVAGLAEAIDELAGGNTATYVNTDGTGVNRVAVITDGFTVRILMLTSQWKWRGPYTPDHPEGYLSSRGYVPAPEVSDG